MNTFIVKGVVETPFEVSVEADSEFEAEDIAYHRLYDATEGNSVFVEDVIADDEGEWN